MACAAADEGRCGLTHNDNNNTVFILKGFIRQHRKRIPFSFALYATANHCVDTENDPVRSSIYHETNKVNCINGPWFFFCLGLLATFFFFQNQKVVFA